MNLATIKPLIRPNVGHLTVLAAIGLVVIGLEAIATAPTAIAVGNAPLKQAVHLALALVFCFFVAAPHHRLISAVAYPLAGVALLLLVVVLLPMPETLVPRRNGAVRWINLGVTQFQPSELAKIGFLLALARYLRYRENYRTLPGIAIPMVLTFVPMALIVVEPDLGTSMIFLPVLFAMLLAAGAKLRHLLLIMAAGATIIAAVLFVELALVGDRDTLLLKPHQKERIVAMASMLQGDSSHDQTYNYQGQKARILTGAGRLAGLGKRDAATLLEHNHLPEAHNDMIFAVICARWGLIGGLAVLGLFLMLIATALMSAAANKDPFARLVAVGVAAVVFVQVVVNIGMTIGLLPITGMTLPFVSYGGTSLLANFGMLGLVVNVAARRPIVMAKPAFEFGSVGQYA